MPCSSVELKQEGGEIAFWMRFMDYNFKCKQSLGLGVRKPLTAFRLISGEHKVGKLASKITRRLVSRDSNTMGLIEN